MPSIVSIDFGRFDPPWITLEAFNKLGYLFRGFSHGGIEFMIGFWVGGVKGKLISPLVKRRGN
jgi:hypothetical protein